MEDKKTTILDVFENEMANTTLLAKHEKIKQDACRIEREKLLLEERQYLLGLLDVKLEKWEAGRYAKLNLEDQLQKLQHNISEKQIKDKRTPEAYVRDSLKHAKILDAVSMAEKPKETNLDPRDFKKLKKNLKNRMWRLSHLYYIIDENGKEVLFKPNKSQKKLLKNMSWRNLILKARQIGFTTFIDIFALDLALFNPNIRAGIIAHTLPDAQTIFRDKILFAYDKLPKVVKSCVRALKRDAGELLLSNNSSIRVSTSFRSATCVTGETGILCDGGKSIPISDIQVGQKVINSKGSLSTVQGIRHIPAREVTDDLISIKVFGVETPLKITENHRVMVRNVADRTSITWKKAGELELGDYMAFPSRRMSLKSRSGLIDYGPQKWRYENGKRKEKVGIKIEPSFDLGYLAGFYLAEGTCRSRHGNSPTDVTFAIHFKEQEQVIKMIEGFKEYAAPIKKDAKRVHCYRHKDSKTMSVIVNDKNMAHFLTSNFGMGDKKNIPDSLWRLGEEFGQGLLKGLFDGDGYYGNPRSIELCTIRENFAIQVKKLLIALRYGFPSIYTQEEGDRYGRKCQKRYTVRLGSSGNWKFRKRHRLPLPEVKSYQDRIAVERGKNPAGRRNWRRGRNCYWSRIKRVSKGECNEDVYDLILDKEPHNYLTEQGIIHNCQFLHISEFGKICARYPHKAREIITGAIPALHNGFLWIESTAEGREGKFFDMSQASEQDALSGKKLTKNDLKFHFFPWHDNPEYCFSDSDTAIYGELPERLTKYFEELEGKTGIKFSTGQRAWYASVEKYLGDDMMREHPSISEEAFMQSVEGAFYAKQFKKAYAESRIRSGVRVDLSKPVHTAWDLGYRDSTSIWFFQVDHDTGMIRIIDFYESSEDGLEHYVKVLKERGYKYGEFLAPPDIANHAWQTGLSNHEYAFKEFGIRFKSVAKLGSEKVGLMDGIRRVRRLFDRFEFDDVACDKGLKALQSYRKEWDEKKGAWRDRPLHDWASHACLISNTMIDMEKGQKRIDQISVGDKIRLKNGVLGEVVNSGISGYADVLKIKLFTGEEIECTGHHKIFTTRGLVKASELCYSDTIATKENRLWTNLMNNKTGIRENVISNTMGLSIGCGRNEDIMFRRKEENNHCFIEFFTGTALKIKNFIHSMVTLKTFCQLKTGLIDYDAQDGMQQIKNIQTIKGLDSIEGLETDIGDQENMGVYIDIYGCRAMAEFPITELFIMLIEIKKITIYLILYLLSIIQSIQNYILKPILGLGVWPIKSNWLKFRIRQNYGIKIKKDENGTRRIAEMLGKIRKRIQKYVNPVRRNTKHFSRQEVNSVQPNVETITVLQKNVPVYNLTIENHHAYYANGILVSNSDSLRYLALGIGHIIPDTWQEMKTAMAENKPNEKGLEVHEESVSIADKGAA